MTRRRAQGLVEFGLIVAGVALVGILGLSALGEAEKAYFTGILPQTDEAFSVIVSASAPSVQITGCTPGEVRVTQDAALCTVVVTDTQGGAAPLGTVKFGASAQSCSTPLTAVSGSASSCSVAFTPTATDAPTAADGSPVASQTIGVSATYVPGATDNGKHLAAASPSVPLIVDPYLNVSATCTQHVEIGHPTVCTATATNLATAMPSGSLDIAWSTHDFDDGGSLAEPGIGCWMQMTDALPPACSVLNPTRPSEQAHCVAQFSGVNPGQCQLVYRRGYDAPMTGYAGYGGVGSHTLTVLPNFCLAATTCGAPYRYSLIVDAPHDEHSVALLSFTCDSGGNPIVRIDNQTRTITVETGAAPSATVTLSCTSFFQDSVQGATPPSPSTNIEFAPACYQDPAERGTPDDQYNPPLNFQCAKFYSTLTGTYFWTYTRFNVSSPDSYRTAVLQRPVTLTANRTDSFQLWTEFFFDGTSPSAHSGAGPDPLRYTVNFI